MNDRDKGMQQALLTLLKGGTFELKGSAVPRFIHLYKWVEDMHLLFDKPLPVEKKKKGKNVARPARR